MITFKTKTGSNYELDEDNRQIRRVSGETDPTPAFAPDGEWKTYDSIEATSWGSLVVWWDAHKYTVTSPVVDYDDNAD